MDFLNTSTENSIDQLNLQFTEELLNRIQDIYKVLKPGVTLTLTLPDQSPTPKIKRAFIFQGFAAVNVQNSILTAKKPNSTTAVDISVFQRNQQIDQRELLVGGEEYKALASDQDCLTKPKPCKNCTCSRRDQLTKAQEEQKDSSNCGRCYMGDAFRCAGCPFAGMPAFMPGETPVIDRTVTVQQAAKVEGGKVRIQI